MKVFLSKELLSKLHLFDDCEIVDAFIMTSDDGRVLTLTVDYESTDFEHESGRTHFALG